MNFPISIIIPIFNEEKRLERGIERILTCCKQQGWDFEIIIVEDGSTDRSVTMVQKFSLKDNRIKLLSLDRRYGKGHSLLQAIRLCKNENIGYLDIDLSADPSEFTRLIRFIDKYDVVIGSRIIREDLKPIQRPFIRSCLSKLYISFFSCLFNLKICDTQCGFKLFKRDSVLPIISSIQVNGFAFDTEFLVKSYLHGLSIKEVPINWHHENNSKLNIQKAILNMSNDILKIWLDTIIIQITNKNMPSKYFAARPVSISKFIQKLIALISGSKSKVTIIGS